MGFAPLAIRKPLLSSFSQLIDVFHIPWLMPAPTLKVSKDQQVPLRVTLTVTQISPSTKIKILDCPDWTYDVNIRIISKF